MRNTLAGLLAAALLVGCGGVSIEDYAGSSPEFRLQEYFLGETRAWGVFQDRGGVVKRQFTVDITGTMEGDELVLTEDFVYRDGERSQRVWRIRQIDEHHYEGRAADVVGVATGVAYGQALNWRYTLAVAVDGRDWNFAFDDWMFLQDDGVLINRARMSKFGIRLGEVTLFFKRGGRLSARRRVAAVAVLAVLVSLGAVGTTWAAASNAVGGIRLAESRQIDGASIRLVNTALYTYLLFDVYAAALYLAPGAEPRAALSDDVARRLEVVYLRDIAAKDLARAARAVLERSLQPAALALLESSIDRLHGWYPDVVEGDRIALNWVPGRGTTLEINGQPLGTIDGAGFAHAYFSIWLGETPIDDGLRAALLAPAAIDGALR